MKLTRGDDSLTLKFIKLNDMKNGVKIFSIILFLWIVGCSYIYVCVIRKDCNSTSEKDKLPVAAENIQIETPAAEAIPKPLVFHFMISSTECQLAEADLNKIAAIEKYLSHNPEKTLMVKGHSDNTGNDLINKDVSYERAMFMKLKLIEGGVDPDIIEVEAKSSSEPVADNSTATGRLMNRRAETIIK